MPLPELDARNLDQEVADYLFDVNGFLILRNAVDQKDVAAMNQWIDDHWDYVRRSDAHDDVSHVDKWIGHVHTHAYSGPDGSNFQNIIEGGDVFEKMIDNPSWIELMRRYCNAPANRLSIYENLLSVRGKGGWIGIHSGGHMPIHYMTFRQPNTGEWMVGQINVITALTDIGPGDGPTTLVPGSHKAAIPHPKLTGGTVYRTDGAAGEQLGMMELYLNKGDTVMFTDAITHGSAERTNPGHRRMILYRYSPGWVRERFNYQPSEALLARLTQERRDIIEVIPPRTPPVERKA